MERLHKQAGAQKLRDKSLVTLYRDCPVVLAGIGVPLSAIKEGNPGPVLRPSTSGPVPGFRVRSVSLIPTLLSGISDLGSVAQTPFPPPPPPPVPLCPVPRGSGGLPACGHPHKAETWSLPLHAPPATAGPPLLGTTPSLPIGDTCLRTYCLSSSAVAGHADGAPCGPDTVRGSGGMVGGREAGCHPPAVRAWPSDLSHLSPGSHL